MSPDAQRVAIAEVLGAKWIFTHRPSEAGDVLTEQKVLTFKDAYHRMMNEAMMVGPIIGKDVPHYPTDLNAMHGAWKILDAANQYKMAQTLYRIVDEFTSNGEISMSDVADPTDVLNFVGNATATQRAEAFLRTLGLWKE